MNDCELEWLFSTYPQTQATKEWKRRKNCAKFILKSTVWKQNLSNLSFEFLLVSLPLKYLFQISEPS